MDITTNTEIIRQQEPGQFRRPEDGEKPYAHAGDEKVKSVEETKHSSVYVGDEKTQEIEKSSDFPKLFDADSGLNIKVETSKSGETESKDEAPAQYDKNGKSVSMTKEETNVVDEWA